MSPPTTPSPRHQDEAIAWLVRVQSDTASARDWVELTAWLEASEAHAIAFGEAEALSAEIGDNAGVIAAGLPRSTAAVLPFAPRGRRIPVWAPLAGLAAAAVVAVVAAPGLQRAYEGAPTTYRTAVGETREVALADGSSIHLDGASTMTVRMGWRSRRIDLGLAQASFSVVHDPKRPFLVNAGDQQVRDVGTEFNIRREAVTVVVSVRRGIVEVRQPGLETEAVARLARGEELRHTVGTQVSRQQRVDPDAAFAWASGRLICHDEPLSQIIAELNRRYAVPIHVTAAAGAKRFSGVLELGDQTLLVRTLADYLSLTVRRTDRAIALS